MRRLDGLGGLNVQHLIVPILNAGVNLLSRISFSATLRVMINGGCHAYSG